MRAAAPRAAPPIEVRGVIARPRHVLATARVRVAGPTCGDRRPFDCAERLGANGNGALVDIWSIHRCRTCDATKNVTVVERTPVRRVSRRLLGAVHANDPAFGRACARDVPLMQRNGMAVVVLAFDEPLLVTTFDVSRSQVTDVVRVDVQQRRDALRLWSGPIRAVRAPRPPS